MTETIIRALVSLVDGIIGLFSLAGWTGKQVSDQHRMGRSKMDDDAHRAHENIMHSWWVISCLILLFAGGAGWAIWKAIFP